LNPTPLKKSDPPRKPDFETSVVRLEEIVQKLESANLSLDDAMKLFEEGVKLSRECQKYLELAEGKVEILLKKAGGEMAAEPFDPESAGNSPPEEEA
jgi:exodeoxyribonuclease VII small subunit